MGTEQKLDLILNQMSEIRTDIQKINTRLDGVEHTIDKIKAEQVDAMQDIINIITINAEAHLDIMHHVQYVFKIYARYEELAINVQTLNTDMRNVKKILSMA